MKKPYHLILGIILFVALAYAFEEITFTLILYPMFLNLMPDIDQTFGSHRNILTHSLILPILVFLFNPNLFNILCLLAFGFHCLCDITIHPKKWRGFYTIKIWRGNFFPNTDSSLKGFMSTFWLFINGLVAIIIFGIYMVI